MSEQLISSPFKKAFLRFYCSGGTNKLIVKLVQKKKNTLQFKANLNTSNFNDPMQEFWIFMKYSIIYHLDKIFYCNKYFIIKYSILLPK